MKIYITSHKKYDFPVRGGIYQPLQVGTNVNGKIDNANDLVKWEYDNCKDNISDKNKSYNELTGLYWVWKNSKEDIVGICHYRRYFVSKLGKACNVLFKKKNGYFSEKDIRKKLSKSDVIVHNKSFSKENNYQNYLINQKYPNDIDIARNVIEEICPEYSNAFNEVMESKSAHLLNMIIGEKSIVDNYCEWLFGVLFEVENRLLASGEKEFDRRMGMLGERLLDVWLVKNKIKYSECFTINTERIDWKPW